MSRQERHQRSKTETKQKDKKRTWGFKVLKHHITQLRVFFFCCCCCFYLQRYLSQQTVTFKTGWCTEEKRTGDVYYWWYHRLHTSESVWNYQYFFVFCFVSEWGTASWGAVRFFYTWTGVSGEVMPDFVPSFNLANAARWPFCINSGQF